MQGTTKEIRQRYLRGEKASVIIAKTLGIFAENTVKKYYERRYPS